MSLGFLPGKLIKMQTPGLCHPKKFQFFRVSQLGKTEILDWIILCTGWGLSRASLVSLSQMSIEKRISLVLEKSSVNS